jgi:hypothetical protein
MRGCEGGYVSLWGRACVRMRVRVRVRGCTCLRPELAAQRHLGHHAADPTAAARTAGAAAASGATHSPRPRPAHAGGPRVQHCAATTTAAAACVRLGGEEGRHQGGGAGDHLQAVVVDGVLVFVAEAEHGVDDFPGVVPHAELLPAPQDAGGNQPGGA